MRRPRVSWRPGATQLYFEKAEEPRHAAAACSGAPHETFTVPVTNEAGATFELTLRARRSCPRPRRRGAPLADATPWIEAQNAEQSLRVWAPHDANADLPEGVWTAASVKFHVMSVERGALHPPRVFDTVDVKVKIDHHFLKASARLPGGGDTNSDGCWDVCGHKSGACPHFCGTMGACCRGHGYQNGPPGSRAEASAATAAATAATSASRRRRHRPPHPPRRRRRRCRRRRRRRPHRRRRRTRRSNAMRRRGRSSPRALSSTTCAMCTAKMCASAPPGGRRSTSAPSCARRTTGASTTRGGRRAGVSTARRATTATRSPTTTSPSSRARPPT